MARTARLAQTKAAKIKRGTQGLTAHEIATEHAEHIEQGLTTAQQIDAFLAARMAERATAGLKIVTLCDDGSLFTCYPKDAVTKQRWLDGFARKGTVVVEA